MLYKTRYGEPTASPSITLHRQSIPGIDVSMEPVFVIVGVPGVFLNTISPAEVVSIEILGDTSAAVIYRDQIKLNPNQLQYPCYN
ncbi:MAG: hypothetical protein HC905_01820 [Bacteroidales bacterium]|nr:hypothetical protein [Bacteroidales bacterium]